MQSVRGKQRSGGLHSADVGMFGGMILQMRDLPARVGKRTENAEGDVLA